MEEIQLRSSDLTAPDPIDFVVTSPKGDAQEENIHQIYRRGDKIYQVMDENVTMIKNGSNLEKSSTGESNTHTEEMRSGESLYKTFTFDNTISAEETEKCLAFWRGVVEKNLEPIKCQLIEKATKLDSEAKKKKQKSSVRGKGSNGKETSQDITRVSMPKDSVWFDILTKLQEKRLKETKLLMEKKCRFCQYVSETPYKTDDPLKDNKHTIKELLEWEPKSYKKSNYTTKMQRKSTRTSTLQQQLKDLPALSLPLANVDEEDKEEEEDIAEERGTETMLANIKEASGKIKHINVIEKKKQLGSYSQWRANKVETCECGQKRCDCNINPAIKSIKKPESLDELTEILKPNVIQKIEMVEQESSIESQQLESNEEESIVPEPLSQAGVEKKEESATEVYPTFPRRSILIIKDDDGSSESESRSFRQSKYLSVKIPCVCSSEECDCHPVVTAPQKPVIPQHEAHLPEAPKLSVRRVKRVNSIELTKKRLSIQSFSEESPDKESSLGSINDDVPTDIKPRTSLAISVDSLELIKKKSIKSPKASTGSADTDPEFGALKQRAVSFS